MSIRVAITGAAGRMGREVVRAVLESGDLTLVAAIDHHAMGEDAGILAGMPSSGNSIESDLDAALLRTTPDVLVDFTLPGSVMSNVRIAIERRVSPVVGTTGLSATDLSEIDSSAKQQRIGAFVAPNFAIGAVLMMQFCAAAAKHMPDVEIIELHHDRKVDSPSGTAILTAQKIGKAREDSGVSPAAVPDGLVEKAHGARGAHGR